MREHGARSVVSTWAAAYASTSLQTGLRVPSARGSRGGWGRRVLHSIVAAGDIECAGECMQGCTPHSSRAGTAQARAHCLSQAGGE